MNKHYDACCFIGNWPFRKIHKGKLSDLMAEHMKNGISGGLCGCLDSVFYNDPYEGDEECAKALEGSGYSFAATLNPTLTGALDDLDRIKNELHASAVRLYPANHGYSLKLPCVIEAAKKAGELGLRVIITVRTEDIRIDYLFRQTPLNVTEIPALVEACPETKFLLSSIYIGEVSQIRAAINKFDNLWVDMSRFNHMLFVAEKAVAMVSPKKLIFGSSFPLLALKCMLLNIESAKLPEEAKELMLSKNYEDFMA